MFIEVSIEDDVLAKLKIIAARNARSLEEEIISLCELGISRHEDDVLGPL